MTDPNNNRTILLVEDDASHVGLIRRALDRSNTPLRLNTAGNLAEARRSIRNDPPDLALIDLFLPDGRGTDLMESLPSPPPFPIVIMTSHGDEKIAVETIKAGALDYRVKSEAAFTEMAQTVNTALREWATLQERNRAVEELKKSEERFRAITENTTDITLILDNKGRFRYLSPSVGGFGGYTRSDVIGKHPRTFVHPEDLPRLNEVVKLAFAHPHESYHIDSFRVYHKDGNFLYIESIFINMRGVPGVDGLVVNCRDISKRRTVERELEQYREHLEELVRQRTMELVQSEEKLRRVERLSSIGTLAAGIAHEINNPIGAIQLYAQTALRMKDDPGAGKNITTALEEIVEQCGRCDRIIRSVLQFSRLESAEKDITDIAEVAKNALKNVKGDAEKRNATIKLEVEGVLLPILANRTGLEQVFVNLILNAIQASGIGGTIRVILEGGDDSIVISVADTGHGIRPEAKVHIFDPFYTGREIDGGTGLGLSIVHGVIESHQGTIDVESIPGQGTVIRITLPVGGKKEVVDKSGIPAKGRGGE